MTRHPPSRRASRLSPLFAPLFALLLLPLPVLADAERQGYACDNGSRIDISFAADGDGRPRAILHFADGEVVLPQVPAASGALYRNETVRLHTRGDEALFEDGHGNLRRCRLGEMPAAASPATSPATSPAAQPAASGGFIDIAGSVGYRQRVALPPDAVLIVRVKNTAPGAPARVLAEQRIELAGRQAPIPFKTSIDRDLLGKKPRLAVAARIEQRGRLRFAGDKAYPDLRDGSPETFDIVLKQVGGGQAR